MIDFEPQPVSRDRGGPVATVLMPAAGAGTRLGGERKQFRMLGQAPLFIHAVRVFQAHPRVAEIVLAVPGEVVGEVQRAIAAYALPRVSAVVAGGATRRASVALALAAARTDTDIVLVHDAVRPFIEAEHVSAVIEAVEANGAASLAIPVADTVRRGEAGFFTETVSREGLYAVQTPQGFRREWLERAHHDPMNDGLDSTDDVELVRRCGYEVALVLGSPRNVKITTPDEWALARLYLDAR